MEAVLSAASININELKKLFVVATNISISESKKTSDYTIERCDKIKQFHTKAQGIISNNFKDLISPLSLTKDELNILIYIEKNQKAPDLNNNKDYNSVKCIHKFRDKHNRIIGYRLQDNQGNTKDIAPEVLKNAIRNNIVKVENLSLTIDNRLIEK